VCAFSKIVPQIKLCFTIGTDWTGRVAAGTPQRNELMLPYPGSRRLLTGYHRNFFLMTELSMFCHLMPSHCPNLAHSSSDTFHRETTEISLFTRRQVTISFWGKERSRSLCPSLNEVVTESRMLCRVESLPPPIAAMRIGYSRSESLHTSETVEFLPGFVQVLMASVNAANRSQSGLDVRSFERKSFLSSETAERASFLEDDTSGDD
jgi:hypothetical protein